MVLDESFLFDLKLGFETVKKVLKRLYTVEAGCHGDFDKYCIRHVKEKVQSNKGRKDFLNININKKKSEEWKNE